MLAEQWLQNCALENDIKKEWLDSKLKNFVKNIKPKGASNFNNSAEIILK